MDTERTEKTLPNLNGDELVRLTDVIRLGESILDKKPPVPAVAQAGDFLIVIARVCDVKTDMSLFDWEVTWGCKEISGELAEISIVYTGEEKEATGNNCDDFVMTLSINRCSCKLARILQVEVDQNVPFNGSFGDPKRSTVVITQ